MTWRQITPRVSLNNSELQKFLPNITEFYYKFSEYEDILAQNFQI